MTDNAFDQGLMKTQSRGRLRMIWELGRAGAPLNAGDTQMVRIMAEHPEYADLWPYLDSLSDAEIERDGANPIMHVVSHQFIENQLAQNDPPEARQALDALTRRGTARHEAIHMLAHAFMTELYNVLAAKRGFDEQGYVRRLRRLARAR